jgi:hypothetical protein
MTLEMDSQLSLSQTPAGRALLPLYGGGAEPPGLAFGKPEDRLREAEGVIARSHPTRPFGPPSPSRGGSGRSSASASTRRHEMCEAIP